MILSLVLLIIIVITIAFLIKYLQKNEREQFHFMPICRFKITNPNYTINKNIRIAKFKVYSKNQNRYFQDFPIQFSFFSDKEFKSKIKIEYICAEDNESELIYDSIVEFDKNKKQHIYYINDVIMGSIDIDIETDTYYGKPNIRFEILQNTLCHMDKEHAIDIIFPN